MTDEEIKKEFNEFLKDKNIHYKPNPNHYPIIDKWNLKYQYNPHKREIFNKIEYLISERIKTMFNKEMREMLHINEVNNDG